MCCIKRTGRIEKYLTSSSRETIDKIFLRTTDPFLDACTQWIDSCLRFVITYTRLIVNVIKDHVRIQMLDRIITLSQKNFKFRIAEKVSASKA